MLVYTNEVHKISDNNAVFVVGTEVEVGDVISIPSDCGSCHHLHSVEQIIRPGDERCGLVVTQELYWDDEDGKTHGGNTRDRDPSEIGATWK